MNFVKIVEEIRTIRDFKKSPVDQKLIDEIIDFGKNTRSIVPDAEISIKFIENGSKLYKELYGKAGYYGQMIEAPHYIAISSKLYPNYLENSGYIMEAMRLKAWDLGLGTAWLDVEEEETLKDALDMKEEVITAFIAIGEPYKGLFKKDLSPKSTRMGITDMVYHKTWGEEADIEFLDERGITNLFYYAKLAPSWGNIQPWRFIVDDGKIYLAMEKEESKKIDAGIMMLYLDKASHAEGIIGKWIFEKSEKLNEKYNIPDEYEIIAYYSV